MLKLLTYGNNLFDLEQQKAPYYKCIAIYGFSIESLWYACSCSTSSSVELFFVITITTQLVEIESRITTDCNGSSLCSKRIEFLSVDFQFLFLVIGKEEEWTICKMPSARVIIALELFVLQDGKKCWYSRLTILSLLIRFLYLCHP